MLACAPPPAALYLPQVGYIAGLEDLYEKHCDEGSSTISEDGFVQLFHDLRAEDAKRHEEERAAALLRRASSRKNKGSEGGSHPTRSVSSLERYEAAQKGDYDGEMEAAMRGLERGK